MGKRILAIGLGASLGVATLVAYTKVASAAGYGGLDAESKSFVMECSGEPFATTSEIRTASWEWDMDVPIGPGFDIVKAYARASFVYTGAAISVIVSWSATVPPGVRGETNVEFTPVGDCCLRVSASMRGTTFFIDETTTGDSILVCGSGGELTLTEVGE